MRLQHIVDIPLLIDHRGVTVLPQLELVHPVLELQVGRDQGGVVCRYLVTGMDGGWGAAANQSASGFLCRWECAGS